MQAQIKQIKPDPVEIRELRYGDNFEFDGWIYKVLTGVKQFTTGEYENSIFAATESSGEVRSFSQNTAVYPLLDASLDFEYDFERKFEEGRY